MEKVWSNETRPLTMLQVRGEIPAQMAGRPGGSTNKSGSSMTGAATEDEGSRRFL
jgi:hypothetical protein